MSKDRMVLETAVGEPHAALGVAISRLGFHTPGRLGNAGSFDGVESHALVANIDPLNPTDAITVCAWTNALGNRCRYYPSCSEYAVQAIRSYGILRGLVLAAWRLWRARWTWSSRARSMNRLGLMPRTS